MKHTQVFSKQRDNFGPIISKLGVTNTFLQKSPICAYQIKCSHCLKEFRLETVINVTNPFN